jgi:hypothetical protein
MIYYSGRRGWIFPPAGRGLDWWKDITNETSAIEAFDELQAAGAHWFGIVAKQKTKLRQTTPRLWQHIENATEPVSVGNEWTIYRILSKTPKF